MCRRFRIGIDRLIRLQWLEETARLQLAGADPDTIGRSLEKKLADYFPTSLKERRSSLGKTITVLMKVWTRVPRHLQGLRDSGLGLYRETPDHEHVPLHWGMIMAAYPFWAALAAQVGRLLRLQGNLTAAQAQRRLREQYGERTTVSRRVRYVLRAYIDWGALVETDTKGVYAQSNPMVVNEPKLISWLVEASLHGSCRQSAPLRDLIENPSLFPFNLGHISASQVAQLSPRLDILQHHLNDHHILLKGNL